MEADLYADDADLPADMRNQVEEEVSCKQDQDENRFNDGTNVNNNKHSVLFPFHLQCL